MRHTWTSECGMNFFHSDDTVCASYCGVYQMMMYLSSRDKDQLVRAVQYNMRLF